MKSTRLDIHQKPSLLVVSHTYAIEPHALKLAALKEFFEVTCVTVSRADSGLPPAPETGLKDRLVDLRLELPVWGGVPTRYWFRGLNKVIRSRVWDFMLVEAEPWQPLKWQALVLAKLAGRECVRCYGEFTWENILRPGLKGWVFAWAYRLTARVLDFWVAGNQTAGAILRDFGMPSERVLVCTQVGVKLPAVEKGGADRNKLKAAAGLTEGAFVAGFAGRLVLEKGIEDLYQAVRMANAREGRIVELVLMGRGPLESKMRSRQESGEAPWLRLVPPVTFEEVEEQLPMMDLLVLGSHRVRSRKMCWEEQFGHILVEAMATGVVVCGARSGAIPEVIGDEAMLFESGDVVGLAVLLRRCADDPSFFDERRRRQGQRVREEYTHEAVALRHAAFLAGIQPRS